MQIWQIYIKIIVLIKQYIADTTIHIAGWEGEGFMKNVLKQFGKSICYLLLMVGMQFIVMFAMMIFYSVNLGIKLGLTGETPNPEQVAADIMSFILNNQNWIVIIYAFLTMLALWLLFLIRRKNVLREAALVPFQPGKLLPVIILGLGMGLFMNFGLQIVPLPEELLNSYAESSQMLFQNSAWVLILSNVIAAPVVEETVFRGLIMRRLDKAMPTWVAVVISSVAFGALHGHPLWATYTAAGAVLFAVAAIKCSSTAASLLVHMLLNLTGTLLVIVNPEVTLELCVGGTVLGLALLIIGLVLLLKKPRAVA